jgi:hypothetical protein
MAARVQVVVEAKDATSGVFRAITSQLGAFGGLVEEITAKQINWGNVGQQAAQMVINGLKESIRATTEYAREVRDLSLASGQSAEESSRMLQVLDDYQLTAEDAKTATRALTKEGLAPTIDTIAHLSSEYLNLTSIEERNAFVQKNLGRAGQEWLNLLNQGPAAIRRMNGAVSDNLILTEENIRAAEEYRLALDEWGDAVEGVKIAIGTELLPAMTGVVDEANNTTSAIQIMRDQGLSWLQILDHMAVNSTVYTDALRQAADTTTEYTAATEAAIVSKTELEAAEKAAAEAAKLTSQENQLFISVLGQTGTALEAYRGGLAAANAELAAGTITVDEHKAKVGELSAEYEAAKNQIVLSIVEMKLATDGWTDAELSAYLSVGQKLGVFTTDQKKAAEGAILMAERMIDAVDPINHVGERAEDAALKFGDMADSSEELGEKINSSALPAVAGLKTAINGLQDKTVYIDVVIRQHGGSGSGIFNDGFLEDSGGPLCFAAGTPVTLSDGRTKPIEKIQVGDAVRSYSLARREFVTGKVTQNFQRSQPAYLNIDGIKVTVEHPFWLVNRSEWVKASEIKRNDILMRDNGSWQTVRNITFIVGEIEVYNMEVEGEHNYFAGGVLVHNKTQQGGEVFAGQPTLVGEAGPEPFVPSQNGRILGHAESLHAMTLGGGGAGGMGGGITMYNYGHVTVSGDSETGKDFMEIR